MADGWATFGKGVFIALAVAGGVWIGRGGNLPVLEVPGGRTSARQELAFQQGFAPSQSPSAAEVGVGVSEPPRSLPATDPNPSSELPTIGTDRDNLVANVSHTAATPLLASSLTQNSGTVPANSRLQVQSVLDTAANLVWPPSHDVWLSSRQITLRCQHFPPNDTNWSLQVFLVGTSLGTPTPIGAAQPLLASSAGTTDVAVTLPSQVPNDAQLFVRLSLTATQFVDSAPVQIHLSHGQAPSPVIEIASHRAQDFAVNANANSYNGFIRFRGRNTTANSLVRLLVADQATVVSTNYSSRASSNGEWSLDVSDPRLFPIGHSPTVRFIVEAAAARGFATDVITINGTSPSGPMASPELLGIKVPKNNMTVAVGDEIFTNQDSAAVTWRIPNLSSAASDAIVAMNVTGAASSPPQPLSSSPAPFTFDIPNDGDYTAMISVWQGNQLLAESSSVTIHRRKTGPKPVSVQPDTLPPGKLVHTVVVRFDSKSPLAKDSVKDSQFSLQLSKNDGTTVDAKATLPAKFVDGTTVELTLGELEAGTYHVLVKPGSAPNSLLDVFGNQLQSAAVGTAAHAFPVTKLVGEVLITQGRGISGVTGENAVYPEYTKPRPQQDGFNPSDKVVTRIARLYYFRDAHRVVQLLNREARSYNRQAVDQQQQLADNALRDAENATTDRREAERAAVRAAQQARAAENGLVQAQAALAKAQSETTNAGNGLPDAERAVRDQQTTVDDRQAAVTSAQSIVDSSKSLPQTDPMAMAAQASLDRANADLKAARSKLQALTDQRDDLVRQRDQSAARVTNAIRLVNTALAEVQASRATEITAADRSSGLEAKEDQAQKTLFRREVAAASADPDTYARGNPESVDPLLQVSYSVIGEGEIQLRGPLKGVNLARTLINQIDSPVGQVRVAIHTIQVNGERGERMEPVVERIGRYVDQSRFLTSQSGQMLRNAVTMVAARKAEEAFVECEGIVAADHQVKYLEAFFGKQFIDELREMDSEFLRADNKLLSLHSMDSTSLAQALFLLALAKNDIRQEILCEFERLTTCDLPLAETEYFGASGAAWKFGPPFHKQKYQFLGHNARFVSLRGQFNVQVADPDTLTPMQREFIRLAQIFKSRLVAEREIQQRVMERGLIEDRFADYAAMLKEAQVKEKDAQAVAERSKRLRADRLRSVLTDFARGIREVREILDTITIAGRFSQTLQQHYAYMSFERYTHKRLPGINELATAITKAATNKEKGNSNILTVPSTTGRASFRLYLSLSVQAADSSDRKAQIRIELENPNDRADWIAEMKDSLKRDEIMLRSVEQFPWDERVTAMIRNEAEFVDPLLRELRGGDSTQADDKLFNLRDVYKIIIADDVLSEIYGAAIERVEEEARAALARLADPDVRILDIYPQLSALRGRVLKLAVSRPDIQKRINDIMRGIATDVSDLVALEMVAKFDSQTAESSRRPLDHKKFMDMLVDDAEDKYIEILEGTRAHTANIDNYLGRIITSLDDDFNAQFYNPTFKHIREAGRYWDVQMGQIETTTVLTNNRTFAKVSPQAQMEFDLPKRDILISEAFESAAAAYQDYGALLQDPTFLSLTKMYRGQPPSATYGSALPTPMVRDVLPGLPSATNEKLMIQEGTASPDFPSALESLIPDPAIYKFETGTGFEVRPVIQPDGQAVTFHLNYMYTTNVREPVRADEKHLGRIKRHFVDTDVTLGNFEMREVSKYTVALKASRTARGVPLLEDVPVAGILFRPLPQQQSSLQQNVILSQAAIFPTLFDLMGLRWAPAIADLGTGNLKELDFVTKNRRKDLQHRVFDYSSSQVDEFLRIPEADRRRDLYRPQAPIEEVHPDQNVYPGMNLKELQMMEETVPDSSGPDAESSSRQLPPGPTLSTVPDDRNLPSLGAVPVIQQQSYQVPAKDAWRSAKPQRLPQITPAAPRKPAARPAAEPKRLPVQDKPGSVKMLGPQSNRTKLSAESPIVLTSATRAGDDAPVMLLDRSEDDLFAAPEIRPVSELRSEPRDDTVAKDAGKRRWFKLPFLSRSK